MKNTFKENKEDERQTTYSDAIENLQSSIEIEDYDIASCRQDIAQCKKEIKKCKNRKVNLNKRLKKLRSNSKMSISQIEKVMGW